MQFHRFPAINLAWLKWSGNMRSYLDGVPGWVDKKAFSGVKGMDEPVETKIVLVKTNNGWKAN